MNDTRAIILAEASILFAERDYDAVSMRDIAEAVSIKPASLYHHFKDKEELIRETLKHVFLKKAEPLDTILGMKIDTADQIKSYITRFVDLLIDDPVFTRLMFRELLAGNAERHEYIVKTVFEQHFQRLTETIAARGRTTIRPAFLALSVIALVHGHVQMMGSLPYLPLGAGDLCDRGTLVAHLIRMIEAAIGPLTPGQDGAENGRDGQPSLCVPLPE